MKFRDAVRMGPEPVRTGLRPGKQGLKGEHRSQIDCTDSRRFLGSFDLDASYKALQPNAHRWDYGLGFSDATGLETILWIEVHPANVDQVEMFLRKHRWLQNWLRTEAPSLGALSRGSGRANCFWLATESGVNIRRGSRHARCLHQAGFGLPRRKLILD